MAYSRTCGCDLLQRKDTKQNQQKEKGQSLEKTRYKLYSPFPVELHRTCLIPLVTYCDDI